jgi:hypothetical protein
MADGGFEVDKNWYPLRTHAAISEARHQHLIVAVSDFPFTVKLISTAQVARWKNGLLRGGGRASAGAGMEKMRNDDVEQTREERDPRHIDVMPTVERMSRGRASGATIVSFPLYHFQPW